MTQEQKNERYAAFQAEAAAQNLAGWHAESEDDIIGTLDEITFDWHYRFDPDSTTTRSTVPITPEIRKRAGQIWDEIRGRER